MRVTLADIAKKTGYSTSSVSIALRNDPRLPECTRTIIKETARELGYRPDPHLATIAAHRWRNNGKTLGMSIAFVFDSRPPGKEVRRSYLKSVKDRVVRLGYGFEAFDVRDFRSGKSLSKMLYSRGVRGVVVSTIYDESAFSGFAWELFPGVCCGIGYWRPPYHLVTTDVFESVRLAVKKAVSSGFSRVGAALFLHPYTADDDSRRLGAALFEDDSIGSSNYSIDVLSSDPTDESRFLEWFRAFRPDVVIALHSDVIIWLERAGYSVPDLVAVIGLAGLPEISWSTVNPRYNLIGKTAADMLDLSIRSNEIGEPENQRTVLVEPTWKEGSTLPFG